MSSQDNQICDEAVFPRIVIGLERTASRQDRDESDRDMVDLGDEDSALELPTTSEHEIQVRVSDLLTCGYPGVELPLEILEIDEACSDGPGVERRM